MGTPLSNGVYDGDHQLNRHRPLDLVLVARQCHGDLACETDRIGAFSASFGLLKQRYLNASDLEDMAGALQSLKASCVTVGAHEVVRLCALILERVETGEAPLKEDADDLQFALEDVTQFLRQILS